MIMTTSDHRMTVLDSIHDMAESLHDAADCLDEPQDTRNHANHYEYLADVWEAGLWPEDDQRADIVTALERSELIAREVGEDGAADEYECARIWLEG